MQCFTGKTKIQNAIKESENVLHWMKGLTTKALGQCVLYEKKVTSTQVLLYERYKQYPNGTVCVADEQYHGKGRGSNVWESPLGCIMFSFVAQVTDGMKLPFVQYLISLAIVQVLEKYQKDGVFKIKWPNDIYGKGLKIGGILCQSEFEHGKYRVTTGVGINLDNDKPTTCVNECIRGEVKLTRDEFLKEFCNMYEPMHERLNEHGFEGFKDAYMERWMHTDQRIVLQEQNTKVLIKGLTKNGCLLAVDENGQQVELYPDGNSLDFLNGLMKRKI